MSNNKKLFISANSNGKALAFVESIKAKKEEAKKKIEERTKEFKTQLIAR